MKISVIIRFHEHDNISYLLSSISSVLVNKEIINQIVIVQTNCDIRNIIDSYFAHNISIPIDYVNLSSVCDNRAEALTSGINTVINDYIIFLDSDDFILKLPSKSFLEKFLPFDMLAFSYVEHYFQKKINSRIVKSRYRRAVCSDFSAIEKNNRYPLGSFIISKSRVEAVEIPEMTYLEDYYLLLSLYFDSKSLRFFSLDIPSFIYFKEHKISICEKYRSSVAKSELIIKRLKNRNEK